MQIVKFKKISNGKYKIFFSSGIDIILHEDIILKYGMLINKYIDAQLLDAIIIENNNYMVYDLALKYIKIKLRCENEIRDYLQKKNIEQQLIEKIVYKLKNDGYLDSKLYIKSYINDKFNINNMGPLKIKKELIGFGFKEDDIEEELSKLDKDEILIKLNRMIDKKIVQTKNYSGFILKKKIIDYFVDKGFCVEDIEYILNNKDLSSKEDLKKEYDKLYKKYSKKYSGSDLEKIIKQKLYQKGFNYNEM